MTGFKAVMTVGECSEPANLVLMIYEDLVEV